MRAARSARRRNGGVVMITYAAAMPAAASTVFAAVRAPLSVTCQLRRDPPDDPVDLVPVVRSGEPPRRLSEPVPYVDPVESEPPAPAVVGDPLPLTLPAASRTYRCASSTPRAAASRALSYISRPR